jgi:hypothetical protein
MGDYNFEEKSAEEILKGLENYQGKSIEWWAAAIQVKIVNQLCRSIGAAGGDFVNTSTALKESINDSSKALKDSIDEFRKSNERNSRALNLFTLIIGIAAVIQVVLFVYKIICP